MKLFLLEVDRRVADVGEKVLVVGDNEERVGPALEVLIKPNNGIEIQMVCRFIEK